MGIVFNRIFEKFFGGKEARIVMIGLDSSGKTTTLYRITNRDEVFTTIPTIGFNVENFTHDRIQFEAWDLGGQSKIRNLWHHYYRGTDALVVLIDSNDTERFEELKHFLMEHLQSKELWSGLKVLFLANKQDLPNAASCREIVKKLELEKIVPKQFDWFIQPCCSLRGDGLDEGFDWLSKKL